MGAIIDSWPRDQSGRYPPEAYQAAYAIVIFGLIASLAWLMRPGEDKLAAEQKLV